MLTLRSTLLLLSLTLLGCVAEARAADRNICGVKLNDWCPSHRGDPCARHKNAADCKADPKCYGMPYRGESLIACRFDERGFASNCPTVGCTNRAPARPKP